MTKDQLVEKASGELTLGLDAAAQMIADWLRTHDEALAPLCKSVTESAGIPQAWDALRKRVQRMEDSATTGAESERTRHTSKQRAKGYLASAEPEQIMELVGGLPPERQAEIQAALAPMDRAVRGFAKMGTLEHIEAAIEDINEAVAGAGYNPEDLRSLHEASDRLATAIAFAEEMTGVQR